jgi:hypothetical protein
LPGEIWAFNLSPNRNLKLRFWHPSLGSTDIAGLDAQFRSIGYDESQARSKALENCLSLWLESRAEGNSEIYTHYAASGKYSPSGDTIPKLGHRIEWNLVVKMAEATNTVGGHTDLRKELKTSGGP